MLTSQTKTRAIQRLRANQPLQGPIFLTPRRSARDLSTDQPMQALGEAARAAAALALESGETHYADVPGITPLRQRIAAWLNQTIAAEHYGLDHALVTASIQEARFLSVQVLGERFGSVAIPEVVHPGVAKAAAVRALPITRVPVAADSGLLPSVHSLGLALQGGARLLFLESPSRLTGACYPPADLREIAGLLASFGAAVIWDQGLLPWVSAAENHTLVESLGARERAALIGELWPGLGLESWHAAFVAAPVEWLEAMRVHKQIISICTNTAVQYAALQAAEGFEQATRATRTQLAAERQRLIDRLTGSSLEALPGSAATILALRPPDISRALDELSNSGFLVADGAAFGAPGLLRLSIVPDGSHGPAVSDLLRTGQGGGNR